MSQGKHLVIALDLGGTQFRVALANDKGELLRRYAEPISSPDEPERTLGRMRDAFSEMLTGIDRAEVRGMGAAVTGLIKPSSGVLLTSPNLLAWYNTPLKDIWERDLQVPVWVCNDANLAALGERRFGAGKGASDLVYLTVSTGIGGGVVIGGRLLVGSAGFGAELGHMTIDLNGPKCNCGNVGCLEVLASGTAIARLTVERIARGDASSVADRANGDLNKVTAEMVAQAAASGDALAQEVMDRAGTNLGVGVVSLIHIFNPELVVIGGGCSKAGDLLFGPVRRIVAERTMPDIEVNVVPAALGDDSGLLGAVAMVLEETSR